MEIEAIFKREYGRAVAALTRFLGDIALAEEAVQDAFAIALIHWPEHGSPPSPAGWIITTARHRALDRLRREASRDARQRAAAELIDEAVPAEHHVNDDQLRLIFTCCHPALAIESRVALTLRLLGGLTTPQIARAFLVPETTLGQRLSRAKAKIRDAGIPYRVPEGPELPQRLAAVLGVVYLIFNEGYSPSDGDALMRGDLCDEAIRLGRLLVELLPDETEARGLLALMLFIDARRDARMDSNGAPIRLAEQDRSTWNRERIDEGRMLLRECLARDEPGPYQLQAAINAVHSDAATAEDTDWRQILAIYDQLMRTAPTEVVALNRAVALAEVEGANAALESVDTLALDRYPWFHTVRAELLRRLQRAPDAAAAYLSAIALTQNAREKAFLERQLAALTRH